MKTGYVSPWHSRNGWLGIKHQVTYLYLLLSQPVLTNFLACRWMWIEPLQEHAMPEWRHLPADGRRNVWLQVSRGLQGGPVWRACRRLCQSTVPAWGHLHQDLHLRPLPVQVYRREGGNPLWKRYGLLDVTSRVCLKVVTWAAVCVCLKLAT